jgi:serine/threonine protein kinase
LGAQKLTFRRHNPKPYTHKTGNSYVSGGTLAEWRAQQEAVDEDAARYFFRQARTALRCLAAARAARTAAALSANRSMSALPPPLFSSSNYVAAQHLPGALPPPSQTQNCAPKNTMKTEKRARAQVVAAVHYCHTRQVAHRDVKLENVMLDRQSPPRCRMADFGIARHWRAGEAPKARLFPPSFVHFSPRFARQPLSFALLCLQTPKNLLQTLNNPQKPVQTLKTLQNPLKNTDGHDRRHPRHDRARDPDFGHDAGRAGARARGLRPRFFS